ncbi:HD-domain/PDEase-like protein [Hortaea werneckii]|nr:HD-domain/PDEase-like protein [Hortaea werneckii]KAI7234614.1 HD-domain/PDEase-like protein [Hortaea werneckii]KAI7329209.1 HD-domain/PDEase-like protein [Hortaea werneckii]
MEGSHDERIRVVYYCGTIEGDFCELYHDESPPKRAEDSAHQNDTLEALYSNIASLLDEDEGGFHEVFVSSSPQKCLDRIETNANSVPTVVLIELVHGVQGNTPLLLPEDKTDAFPFLRALSADIHGARYQKHVLPFAVSRAGAQGAGRQLNAETTTLCYNAGALDVICSPFGNEDINRIVGHVKDAVRPSAHLIGANMAQNLVDSICTTRPTKIATHRPDRCLAEDRRKAVEEAVGKWGFPAQEFSMDELTYGALFMLEHMLQVPELEQYRLPRAELITFILAARRQYKHQNEVHYHNWRHAVDVTQSLYCFLLDVRLCPPFSNDDRISKDLNAVERLLTPLHGLILLVSAIGHDVGHPGVNNAFLVACQHPLAQMYNDKSVLENYHGAAFSQLLRRHWPALSAANGFRTALISNILATDMQRHFEYMSKLAELKQKIEDSEQSLSDWNDKDCAYARELMMALLMKAADISNVARPFEISSNWAQILMTEFSRQGELESELGIPTCLFGGPPNKEDSLAAAQSQKGFMGLFGHPLFSDMTQVMPSVSCAITELETNQDIWERKIAQEKSRRESGGDTAPLTFSSVSKNEVEEAETRHRQSLPEAVPEQVPQTPKTPVPRQAVVDSDLAPRSHPASQQRRQMQLGIGDSAEQRSSAPLLPYAVTSSPGGTSRRSSKDVALDQWQHLSSFSHGNMSPSSRRGSADASWQMHQSYPGSRRGSKDESLTTILVTSQGSPARSSGQDSPSRKCCSGKRSSVPQSSKAATRTSVPSSRSHATSSATAATSEQSQHSNSTQPSSLAATDDEAMPSDQARSQQTLAPPEESLVVPGTWPSGVDGAHSASAPNSLSPTPPPTPGKSRAESPRIIPRIASGESDDRTTARKATQGLRESRSRSRLRNLKFWKKRREPTSTESGDNASMHDP